MDLFLGVGMEDAGGRSHVSQDGLKRYSQRRPSTSDPLASTFPSVVISVMKRLAPVYGVLGIKPRTVRFRESTLPLGLKPEFCKLQDVAEFPHWKARQYQGFM